jgi:phytoene dehydrogenase-like protein
MACCWALAADYSPATDQLLIAPKPKKQKEGFPKSVVGLGEDPHQEAQPQASHTGLPHIGWYMTHLQSREHLKTQ